VRPSWRRAAVARRVWPAAQPRGRAVWPLVGDARARHVARQAWRCPTGRYRPGVVPPGVRHAQLALPVPERPAAAGVAVGARPEAPPALYGAWSVHQPLPTLHRKTRTMRASPRPPAPAPPLQTCVSRYSVGSLAQARARALGCWVLLGPRSLTPPRTAGRSLPAPRGSRRCTSWPRAQVVICILSDCFRASRASSSSWRARFSQRQGGVAGWITCMV